MGIERDVFLEQSNGTRNGHYCRDLTTKYGHIGDLRVPRDREGTFRTQIFQPWQRYTGITFHRCHVCEGHQCKED